MFRLFPYKRSSLVLGVVIHESSHWPKITTREKVKGRKMTKNLQSSENHESIAVGANKHHFQEFPMNSTTSTVSLANCTCTDFRNRIYISGMELILKHLTFITAYNS